MKIELEHHLVYHAREYPSVTSTLHIQNILPDYELGRLLSREGDDEAARKQFDLVLSGKPLETAAHGRRGKYSMEVGVLASHSEYDADFYVQQALLMRTHAAVDALGHRRLL